MPDIPDTAHQVFHQRRLEAALRPRLQHLKASDLQGLLYSQRAIYLDADGAPLAWFSNSSETLRQALLKALNQQQSTRRRLAWRLAGLHNITDFAEPLLTQALREQYGVQVDVKLACLHRWASDFEGPRQGIGGRRVEKGPERRVSLLEAALQNFEENEDFHFSFISRSGNPLDKLALRPADFARLSRQLDLGQAYQNHLQQVFDTPSTARQLSRDMTQAISSDFQVTLQRARMTGDISASSYQMLQALMAQGSATLDGKAVACRRISMLDCELGDVLLIGPPAATSAATERCIAWMAAVPSQPLKEYASTSAFASDLAAKLKSADFFSAVAAKVPQGLQGVFAQRVDRALYAPAAAADGAIREALTRPRLEIVERTIPGPLWTTLQDLQVRRLKANARVLAVPTGDEDYLTRLGRLEVWLQVGVNVLSVAAFVVPGLNEVMLAVTGAQIMDSVFHGVHAWEQGETAEAVQQFVSVGLNLGAFAGLGAVGAVLRPSSFVDGLVQVELPNGQARLWKSDLNGYASDISPGADVEANELGQYLHDGRHFLRFDQQWYEQRYDAQRQQWRLVHPNDPEAYEPPLAHNGEGVWTWHGEQPLNWERRQLLRRLGALSDGLDDTTLERAAAISGIDEAALRHLYVHQNPVPALLADTLQRLQFQRRASRLVETIRDGELTDDELAAQRGEIFARLYRGTLQGLSPGALRLIRDFPSLPARVAREIESQATLSELEQLQQTGGRVPLRLAEEARVYQQQVRLCRALEGLHGARPDNLDSERLALGLLESLPGWTGDVRLELREHVLSGRLLAAVGRADGELKSLVNTGRRYCSYDAVGNELFVGKDFYAAVLRALPDAERNALGVQVSDSQPLQHRLQALAFADRTRSSRLLGQRPARPWHQSPLRLADGRAGYPLGGAVGTLGGEARRRLGRLYPQLDRAQIGRLLGELRETGVDVADSITALESQYRQLQVKLDYWARPLARHSTRRAVATRLKMAWQRGGGASRHKLDLKGLDLTELPTLDATFSHITELDLRSVKDGAIPSRLFDCFPKLRALGLNDNALEQIPASITKLLELEELALTNNRLQVSQTLLEPLRPLRKLKIISLARNQLGELADGAIDTLTSLPVLTRLELQSNQLLLDAAQIDKLADLQLNYLDLHDNRITLDEAASTAFAKFIYLNKLILRDNPLRRAPDLSFMPWLKELDLSHCELSEWPQGLTRLMDQNQYQLRSINLADNTIEAIPSLVETRFGQHVLEFGQRGPLSLRLDNNPLNAQGVLHLHAIGLPHVFSGETHAQPLWLNGVSQGRQDLWRGLFDEGRNHALKSALSTLERSQAVRVDLAHVNGRVWGMLELAGQDQALTENLEEIAAGYPETCGDAGADVFSALEVEVMAYRLGNEAASEQGRVDTLLQLYRQLYRRHQVERIADRISSARQIARDVLSEGDPLAYPPLDPLDDISDQDLSHTVDDIEIRLALRQALSGAKRLNYPEPSSGMLYRHTAYVSDRLARRVEAAVRVLDTPLGRREWLLELPGWWRFVKQRYQGPFMELSERWYQGLEYADYCLGVSQEPVRVLDDSLLSYLATQAGDADFTAAGITPVWQDEAGNLMKKDFNEHQYKVFTDSLQRGRAEAERTLLARLTPVLD
ncbi:dermonecrotic toxin domain-containing protein [Pseudomonas rubra]|uniref:RING-type E3 ubiquitin transferase n=1 Tax=Pseudomonas rubra TaxID=2942627 RepID=A0ABT5PBK7_9PSED|nr:DUF6543 domain-containing protein [Pseudomonas rubra]MDD1015610.1 hypothetical protein [Pseudomonas rubra]MDD1040961.1 hypothetical protein [Pseudomonas rubra]MDD1154810.1 hypothetical protein [Pseudomonas rubra]